MGLAADDDGYIGPWEDPPSSHQSLPSSRSGSGSGQPSRGNPIGLGVTLAGAATIILSLFLPVNEPTGPFARIQENTLIQSDGGWFMAILAIVLAVGATRAYLKPDTYLWIAPLAASLALLLWVALIAVNDATTTLYPIVDGVPDTSQPGQVTALGVAVYVAGVGSIAASVGSLMLKDAPAPELDLGPDLESDPIVPEPPRRRKCPDCAELILVEAKVCKHCGYRFKPAPSAASTPGKVVVNCPRCAAEQRIPKDAERFRCAKCRETVDTP